MQEAIFMEFGTAMITRKNLLIRQINLPRLGSDRTR
jgi:hypothetical protein